MIITLNLNALSLSIIFLMLLLSIQKISIIYSTRFIDKNKVESLDHFSKIFLIIFYLIEKQLSKKTKGEKKYISKNLLILLLCTITLSIIYNYFRIFFPYNEESYEMIILIQLLFFYFFHSLIFEKQIYKHQILSITINLFLIVFYIFNKWLLNLKLIIIIIFSYVSSYSLILVKYINQKYFISIYILGSMNGLIDSIFTLYQLKENIFFENINFGIILLILFNLLLNLFLYYVFYQIIMKLGPIYAFMSGAIGYDILNIIIEIVNLTNLLHIIFLLTTLLSALIYLEFLELNFYDLNHNLKKKIIQRNNFEIQNIILNNSIFE